MMPKRSDAVSRRIILLSEIKAWLDRSRITSAEEATTKAVAYWPILKAIHGTFRGVEHWWCVFVDDESIVLDPCPVDCLSGPLLVSAKKGGPWSTIYCTELKENVDDAGGAID